MSGGDPSPGPVQDVTTVIPALDRVDGLLSLLNTGIGSTVIVVDDGSREPAPIARAAARFGATLVRHEVNRGPAAARNTGARTASSGLVAFVDSDCVVESDWVGRLVGHFDDPGVAAVAPRVAPMTGAGGALARFEQARSALDMGRRPELVRHGSRLGFVPSAALVVRRQALGPQGFDEDLRLGEDVDLVWRLDDAGWQVRYDPRVIVRHRSRERLGAWARRSFEYGTSAADLEARHAGHLAPARLSAWNLATLALVARGHPLSGLAVAAVSAVLLARHLRGISGAPTIACETVARGVLADAAQVGRLLRREWWPVGVLALAAAPRSGVARAIVACMAVPVALDYGRERPRLDPLRYALLQWIDDAAYGSGVIASSVRSRSWAPLLPRVRMPRVRRAATQDPS
jgi:mycofactocin system glycosyltransferase